jgi:hypothetical protein
MLGSALACRVCMEIDQGWEGCRLGVQTLFCVVKPQPSDTSTLRLSGTHTDLIMDLERHRLEAKEGAVGHCAALACNECLQPSSLHVSPDKLVWFRGYDLAAVSCLILH